MLPIKLDMARKVLYEKNLKRVSIDRYEIWFKYANEPDRFAEKGRTGLYSD